MLKSSSICILIFVGLVFKNAEQLRSDELNEKFEQFIKQYNKTYKNEEEKAIRFGIFGNNLQEAEQLNQLHNISVFGMTKFSDWSAEEFNKINGHVYRPRISDEGLGPIHMIHNDALPEKFDWREKDAVTPVKDQGECGSCWAFSVIANLESQYALTHKKFISLSEQQLIDCVKGSKGCAGGQLGVAMQNLITSGSNVYLESDYPYVAHQNKTCEYIHSKGVVLAIGFNYLTAGNEQQLKSALYFFGPFSFSMNADYLQSYTGGIIPICANGEKNHAMLLVGYGFDNDTNTDYWIVKNSWGTDWGEDGYFRMELGTDICGILAKDNIICSQVE